jgi:hypothetical protein
MKKTTADCKAFLNEEVGVANWKRTFKRGSTYSGVIERGFTNGDGDLYIVEAWPGGLYVRKVNTSKKVLFCFSDEMQGYSEDDSFHGGWIQFCATTEEYWKAEQCLDDCFREDDLGDAIPGVSNTMEASFELDPKYAKNRDEARKYLEGFGLVYSQDMHDYINN